MDPVKAAHDAQAGGGPEIAGGRCARCASPRAATIPVGEVVSSTFTGFDAWRDPRGARLCAACAWAYRTPQLRTHPHQVTSAPACTQLSATQVCLRLTAGPLPADTALSVPLHPGRKHLVPYLQWGTVRVDDANLVWTAADARRLEAMCELRRRGFGARALTQSSPPWDALRRRPADEWAAIQNLWADLGPWRAARAWLALGIAITKENA